MKGTPRAHHIFSLFRSYTASPIGKGCCISLNKLESPSHKDALWQVWLKLTQWFWRRRFLNFSYVFLLFRSYTISPIGKGCCISFIWTNLNPHNTRMLFAKFGRNWHSGSLEENEHEERWWRQQWRRTTDIFWSEKLTWAFALVELIKL